MKHLVIDTNVLVSDPTCVYKFKENLVVIPATVLHELDSLKDRKGKEGISAEVREAIRVIESIVGDSKPRDIVKGVEIQYPEGMEKHNGRLSVFPDSGIEINQMMSEKSFEDKPDNRIIAITLILQKKHSTVALVSNDINMRLIASSSGVENVEIYRNDLALDDAQLLSSGTVTIKAKGWNDLDAEIVLDKKQYALVSKDLIENPYVGAYVLFDNQDSELLGTISNISESDIKIETKSYEELSGLSAWGIKPRNNQQKMAFDMLLDPQVEAVVLFGPAGTGKTLLALAAGIEAVIHNNQYDKIICTRSIVDLDQPIGFTPGTEEQKMQLWLGGFDDAIEALHKNDEKDTQSNYSSGEYIMEKANVQFKALTGMRGRSLKDTFAIIDESQNLTAYQMKSIVSRASENCKLIFLGNLSQIDNYAVSALTSGLTHLVVKSQHYPGIRSLHLPGIERSGLAKFAEEHL